MASSQEAVTLVTTIGRWVWGDPFTRATTDYDGNNYEDGKGPFAFGFAVEKANKDGAQAIFNVMFGQTQAFYGSNAVIMERATKEFQHGFSLGVFRFKVKDGDKPNAKGRLNENTKGCWVFSVQTYVPIKVCHYGLDIKNKMGQPIPNNAEIEPSLLKCGYYVDLSLSIRVNEKTDGQAGVYLNPNVIRLRGIGPEIVGGMSTEEAFANAEAAPVYVPAGMSTALPGGMSVGAGAGVMPGAGVTPTGIVPNDAGVSFPNVAQTAGLPGVQTGAPATTQILPTVAPVSTVAANPHMSFVPQIG